MWGRNALAGVLTLVAGCADLGDGEVLRTGGPLGRTRQALSGGGDLRDPVAIDDELAPATDYTLFEADPVRPVAVLEKSELVAVTNTVGDYLELVRPGRRGVRACGRVKVGMRPVAVAVIDESERDAELWVVNHLSDSVSRVRIDPGACAGEVVDTLHVGDEPRDIVVSRDRRGRRRVFVATAHRGQHHPVPSARLGADLLMPPAEKEHAGMADVLVFDPDGSGEPVGVVNLFTDKPRALAAGDGVVYAAGFHTGNRTSVVLAEVALARGLASLREILSSGSPAVAPSASAEPIAMDDPYHLGPTYEGGPFWERDGELAVPETVRGKARVEGGVPAVVGRGRCMPDPRPERTSRFEQQVCVQVDEQNRIERIVTQRPGQVERECQCTSGDGSVQPTTSVIVQFFAERRDCGEAFTVFPDGSRGCWLDAHPRGARTPAAHEGAQPAPMEWNDEVRFSLPDQDVFAIDAETLEVAQSFAGVGTIIFGLAVQPGTRRLVASNTEAMNLTRFEGAGNNASTTVRGHLHESRLTLIGDAGVSPVHLNTHVDYGRCCERRPGENGQSFAFPTSLAFSKDGRRLYFTALGSDKVGVLETRALNSRFDNTRARRSGQLWDITLGQNEREPAGPVGLALDAKRGRLYVKTHFTNELVVLDEDGSAIIDRVAFTSAEPESITRGRHVLYNARLTSSHGDSACASCHVFGDFDGLSWDLGDPDAATVKNPGPYLFSPDVFTTLGITRDPLRGDGTAQPLVSDFRSNKGPMNTQTLRGLANHGAQHWRGDRTRRFQDEPGQHPSFGSLDELSSFGEFDVAIAGLNGNDAPLSAALFQDFARFALQLTLPPNPVRALDDALTPEQASARARYFGCTELSDEQLAAGECIAPDGALVDIEAETRACACAQNPILRALEDTSRVRGFALALQGLLSGELRSELVAIAAAPGALPESASVLLEGLVRELDAGLVQLAQADLQLEAGLLREPAAASLARLARAVNDLLQLGAAHGWRGGWNVLDRIAAEAERARATGLSSAELSAGFRLSLEIAELTRRVIADEDARGTSAFRNLLTGCEVGARAACRLRMSDALTTCHGCHTLDPEGNAEHGVYRPGFFGSDGGYTFENVSQVFKVPHLRNAYQKTGMFGMPPSIVTLPESLLGARSGGFFATEHQFMGPQVRGFGFLHDGSTDTLHRFFGGTPFVARPPQTVNPRDTGNATALSSVSPSPARRAACVAELRQAPPAALQGLSPALGLCLASSPIPDVCFLTPLSPACEQALVALAGPLGDANFPLTFRTRVLPGCLQLGSTLEGGHPDGDCFPDGLRERAELESFVLAFDSNLKPMVGQQVTVGRRSRAKSAVFLHTLLGAAARGHCDAAARAEDRGYLVTTPDGGSPESSVLVDRRGKKSRLGELLERRAPVTLTCYPPQPGRAEARRAAFD